MKCYNTVSCRVVLCVVDVGSAAVVAVEDKAQVSSVGSEFNDLHYLSGADQFGSDVPGVVEE